MKKNLTKLLLLVLTLALVVIPLSSCNKKPDTSLEMKIYLLNGTTALGASKLIVDAKADATEMNYTIETFASADAITGAIVSGECAIAALPTNAAANLYKKSEGKIQLLAINTLGVLYLLDNGEIDPHRITYHKLGHDRYIFVPAQSIEEAKYLYYEYDWKAREIRIFEREQMRAEAAK
jgi:hypothetical protein